MYVLLSLMRAAAGGKHLRIVSRYDWYEEVDIIVEDKDDSSSISIDHVRIKILAASEFLK